MMRGIRLAGRPVDPAARVRILLLSTVVLALLGVVGYALQRLNTTTVATRSMTWPLESAASRIASADRDFLRPFPPWHGQGRFPDRISRAERDPDKLPRSAAAARPLRPLTAGALRARNAADRFAGASVRSGAPWRRQL